LSGISCGVSSQRTDFNVSAIGGPTAVAKLDR
jgi:hypothetical protein